eukprot:Rhum_TRINITY_DN966_c0_g2::Rhum_TRINITY_DN966_c0_g2_i1::g.2883::m.2883
MPEYGTAFNTTHTVKQLEAGEYASMTTDKLLDELDRLKNRVRQRDEKYYRRLKNPMSHAHPNQFWPLCAEAYKLTYWNSPMYYRPTDYLPPVVGAVSALIVHQIVASRASSLNYKWTKLWTKRKTIVVFGLGLTSFVLHNRVMCRMFGLDENSAEIEQYGTMYPQQIEEAAQRKRKYEQEYVRIKDGLYDQKQVFDRIDSTNSYFYLGPAPGQSGYFDDQQKMLKAQKEGLQAVANA